ncbi:hypothetical protein CH063_03474 [Colletotrichum higginsianum]|uniref:Cell wall protein n=2 Tax=Colletotrichum higginsianum TaxID=80884 RepID=H1VXL8_COLHI|nr:hypothetical protein CH63R_08276 [Colletotrichum higginsianum IMI 349063]OBR09511.1 hypothetical protein CH63R_08276 [Colletotrichum higginsianum IMI 349063]TIC95716.1 hypothetical protein CH35J_007901 [Colletotrichum higginsianum]CCF44980.1 hypothetical protein CH063_03474 [Colletotrichum higginsianum]
MHAKQVFAALLVAATTITEARALQSRQIGDVDCNVARLQIVDAISSAQDTVGGIKDATVKDAAAGGLKQASDAIGNIGVALISGQKAAAEDRTSVQTGLNATGTALQGGDQTDDAVKQAQGFLQKAVSAGKDVVSLCK